MSDLTREEIRRAVESVPGWEWDEETDSLRMRDRGVAWTSWEDFAYLPDLALALLESTGEDYQIMRQPENHRWVVTLIHRTEFTQLAYGDEDTLPAAAVRAVNAWAEKRGGKTL